MSAPPPGTSTPSSSAFKTDATRRAALPTADLHKRYQTQAQEAALDDSDAYLDHVEEEWNRRVDAEVQTLGDGMAELVALAQVGEKDKFRVAQEGFEAECRAETMVRAATALQSLAHSLKLLLLLSDEPHRVALRSKEEQALAERLERVREEVAKEVEGGLRKEWGGREREGREEGGAEGGEKDSS